MTIKITPNNSWISVSSGHNTQAFYAVKSDNSLWAWGKVDSANNLLGIDLYSSSYKFKNSLNPAYSTEKSLVYFFNKNVSKVSGGRSHVTVLKTDGSLWSWGTNDNGQLGQGDRINRSIPIQIGTSSWSLVSSGTSNTLAIKSDGTLWSWGSNGYGVLGQGDTISRSSPVQIGVVWKQISAGYSHSVGIKSNGSLWAWGYNDFGELGLGDIISRSSPVQVGTSSWTSVSASVFMSFAIRSDGSLWSWGRNQYGQLGQGDIIHRSSPVQIGTSSWSQVSSGLRWAAAIKLDRTLWTWGRNSYAGQLGQGDLINRSSPVQVGGSWSLVSAGTIHCLAIKTDKTLWSWGDNRSGALGQGDQVHRSSPVQVGTNYWNSVSASDVDYRFSLGIRDNGSLWAWGNNFWGTLGQGDILNRSSPVQIGTSSWISIDAGSGSFAIRSDGTLWAWGYNANGVLGLGDDINRSIPVQIGNSYWTSISAGYHASAIRSDGTLWAWGRNFQGVLGQGDRIHRSSPVQVGNELNQWSFISYFPFGFFDSAYAIKSNRTLWSWGRNNGGNLGQSDRIDRSSPVQVGGSWNLVSGGSAFVSAIKNDNTLWAWGYNDYGQLGLGKSSGPQPSPVQAASGNNWQKISAGYLNSAAIKSDGTLWAWGNNQFGQLGQGDLIHRSSPVQVGGSWTSISVGDAEMAAIRTDGTLWAWGSNFRGKLAQGDFIHRSSPVQIGGSWTSVCMHIYKALAIRTGGTLWSWGINYSGQLGLGDTVNRFSPVQVPGSWSSVYSGFSHAIAIRSDNTLWAWGDNNFGQLGQNSYINYSSPVQIGTSSWSIISANRCMSAAIRIDGRLYVWGDNLYAGLGQGSNSPTEILSPVQLGTSSWSAVSVGFSYMMATKPDGTLWTWGANDWGQLGQQTFTSTLSPIQVGGSWSAISSGLNSNTHSLGIKSDGTIWSWGNVSYGALAALSEIGLDYSSPVQVGTSLWTSVSSGGGHTLAIRSNGTLWAWGRNDLGQLGQNNLIAYFSPVQIGNSSWTSVYASSDVSFAVKYDGTLWAWGTNYRGQLGQGDLNHRSSPVQIGVKSYIVLGSDDKSLSGNDDLNLILKQTGKGIVSMEPVDIGIDNIIDLSLGNNFKKTIVNSENVNFRIINQIRRNSYNFSVFLSRYVETDINFDFDVIWENNTLPKFSVPIPYQVTPSFQTEVYLKDKISFAVIDNVIFGRVEYVNHQNYIGNW
jgi:alpha-tubulin suppressor-like RCC1 family protein